MIVVAETKAFEKQKCLTPEEVEELITLLAENPKAGDLIPRTGGLRKLRLATASKGKSGGSRVIYYYHNDNHPVFLLYAYAKAKQEDLTPDQEKMFAALVQELKKGLKDG